MGSSPTPGTVTLGDVADRSNLVFRDDVVALFPGQGSLSGGAGVAWRDSRHWDVIDVVSDVSGVDVGALLMSASDEDVVRTDRAQLATFALSILGYRELLSRGVRPRYLLGHSLGEFSALVASGLLSLEEGARLIAVRGTAMSRAAAAREGSMVAVMGGDNGTGQIVVSGTREGLDDLLARHKELGWRRATPLPVGGAFHSPLMAPAQEELDEALEHASWGTTDAVLVSNVDAAVHSSAEEWRALLRRQLTSPVEFLDATLALPDSVTTSIELPPSGILTGLTKRIRPIERQFAPSSLAELEEIEL